MRKRTGVIIQARTSSTRLPGKVLKALPYGGPLTVVEQVIRRAKKAGGIGEVIVATSTESSDDPLEALAAKQDTPCFRGSLRDVLGRYRQAAERYDLDIIVRITADCPCLDPGIVERVLQEHLRTGADYTANVLERTYPVGYDVEVFNRAILERLDEEAKEPSGREHVTLYVRNHRQWFKTVNVVAPQAVTAPARRVTLDTWRDYVLLCAVYDALYAQDPWFGVEAVTRLFQEKPWLEGINAVEPVV